MNLESKVIKNITCIKLMGNRLDASGSISFKEKIGEIISKDSNPIILDLSLVKFMDSTGLGSIVSVLKTLGGKRDLVLCGVTGMIVELFKLTRMDRVFLIVDSEADALHKLGD